MQPTLQESLDRILAVCSPLTEAQAQLRLDPSSWSIAEIIEHLAIAERAALVGIKRSLTQPEADPDTLTATANKGDLISTRVSTRLAKAPAPPTVLPTGRYGAWSAPLEAFTSIRQQSIAFETDNHAGLDRRAFPHPLLGPLTLRQWLHFAAAHSVRHTHQIEEILATP